MAENLPPTCPHCGNPHDFHELFWVDENTGTHWINDRALPLWFVIRRYWLHTAIGMGGTYLLWRFAPDDLAWYTPLLAGLLLTIPLVRLTSSLRLGMAAARRGWRRWTFRRRSTASGRSRSWRPRRSRIAAPLRAPRSGNVRPRATPAVSRSRAPLDRFRRRPDRRRRLPSARPAYRARRAPSRARHSTR